MKKGLWNLVVAKSFEGFKGSSADESEITEDPQGETPKGENAMVKKREKVMDSLQSKNLNLVKRKNR